MGTPALKSKYKLMGPYHHAAYYFKTDSNYHHHMNNMVGWVKKLAPPPGKTLDVGCGEGVIVGLLNKEGYDSKGIDLDRTAIKWGWRLQNNVWNIALEDMRRERYDCITILDVLEHVDDMVIIMGLAKSMTDKLVLAVPDHHDDWAVRQNCAEEVKALCSPWNIVHTETGYDRHVIIAEK